MERKRISDKRPVKKMLENQEMVSVNQTAAQIRLVGLWKAKNEENYPVRIEFRMADENEMGTKEDTSGRAVKTGKTSKVKTTFVGVATKLWNRAPTSITQAEPLKGAKREIKK